MMQAVIVDVDGSLVDVRDLREWVTGKRKDFHKFHTLAFDAPPIQDTIDTVQKLWDAGYDIFVVTARDETYKAGTMDWLFRYNVPFHGIYMRKKKDNRADRVVKEEILNEIRKTHDVVLAIDDNPKVIELWQDHGIEVLVVPGWVD